MWINIMELSVHTKLYQVKIMRQFFLHFIVHLRIHMLLKPLSEYEFTVKLSF